MELITNVWDTIKSIVVQIVAVIAEHPIKFAVVLTVVLGAAAIASAMDEAGRKVDAMIEDALDEDEEGGTR